MFFVFQMELRGHDLMSLQHQSVAAEAGAESMGVNAEAARAHNVVSA